MGDIFTLDMLVELVAAMGEDLIDVLVDLIELVGEMGDRRCRCDRSLVN